MQKEKDFIIYINTGFVIDSIICKGYISEDEAIKDLRIKFDNYSNDFIVTKKDFNEYKLNKSN